MSEPVPGGILARYLERTARQRRLDEVKATLEDTWSWFGIHVSSNPEKWTWGQIHPLQLRHDFERLGDGLLGWVGRSRRLGPFPAPGDPDSIWSMHHDGLEPFTVRVGPAFRFAIDLADAQHPLVALCGGQSGHPGDPGFQDGIGPWLRGESRPLWMHHRDVAYHARGVWELEPPSL
jgi:acyl-homoserine lactone acylase PvdQ